jgi:hypothetical protein
MRYGKNLLMLMAMIALLGITAVLSDSDRAEAISNPRWAYTDDDYYVHIGAFLPTGLNRNAYRVRSYTHSFSNGDTTSFQWNWMQIKMLCTGCGGDWVIEAGHFRRAGGGLEFGMVTYGPTWRSVTCDSNLGALPGGGQRYRYSDTSTCVISGQSANIGYNTWYTLEIGAYFYGGWWQTGVAVNGIVIGVLNADPGAAFGAYQVDTRAELNADGRVDVREFRERGGRIAAQYGPVDAGDGIIFYNHLYSSQTGTPHPYSDINNFVNYLTRGRVGCNRVEPGGDGQLRQQMNFGSAGGHRVGSDGFGGICYDSTGQPYQGLIPNADLWSERWSYRPEFAGGLCPAGEITSGDWCIRSEFLNRDARSPLTNIWLHTVNATGGSSFGASPATIDPNVSQANYSTEVRSATRQVTWFMGSDADWQHVGVVDPVVGNTYYRLIAVHQNTTQYGFPFIGTPR